MSLGRRSFFHAIALLALGCSGAPRDRDRDRGDGAPARPLDPADVGGAPKYEDATDAVFDVLLPGAREVEAGRFFGDRELVSLVTGLGLLSTHDGEALDALVDASGGLRAAINVVLDGLASRRAPLARFAELSPASRAALTDEAFDADDTRPVVEIVRVVAFVAYLGATYNDAGLVAIGFPPYEDFDAGIAVSGYPRKTETGAIDDYTYDEEPGPFAVALGLDERGDLP